MSVIKIGSDCPQAFLDVRANCKPILTIHNHTHEDVERALQNCTEVLRDAIQNLFDVVDKLHEKNTIEINDDP